MVTCLLTQPEPRVAALCLQVRAAGLAAIALRFSCLQAIEGAAAALSALDFERFDKIIFVSPSSVWFAREEIARMRRASRPAIAVIGAGTQAALAEAQPGAHALRPADTPYDADHLVAMPEMLAAKNQAMLVVRGERGREDWIERYREQGVDMSVIALYRAVATDPDRASLQSVASLAQADSRALTLVSSMGLAERLIDWLPDGRAAENASAETCGDHASIDRWLRRQPVLVSHPRIASRLTDGGFGSTILPSGEQTLVGAAIQWAHLNA